MKNRLTGIVLAGGKSSRMGYDKGLAKVREKVLIELVVESLKKVCDNIIVIANSDAYNYIGYPVFPDLEKECGPLGGIYTGLFHSTTDDNLVVACDMPFVSDELFNIILKNTGNKEVVIPSVNDQLEPLCGFYTKGMLPVLKQNIDDKNYSVHKVITQFDYTAIPFVAADAVGFTNINTPQDLNKIQ